MLYVTVILCANILIILGNALFFYTFHINSLLKLALSSFSGTLAIIALDGIEAFFIRKLPEKWFSPQKDMFHITEKERKLYQGIGINKWKGKIPELGGFTGFHKNKLKSVSDKAYLQRFVLEARYGVVIHTVNSLLGFLIAFLPVCKDFSVWFWVYAVNFVLNILPALVLRYNLPVLERLLKRAEKR